MRQQHIKENLYINSLVNSKDSTSDEDTSNKCLKTKTDVESRIPVTNPFLRSFSMSATADITDNNNVTMDVLDIKTLLLRLKRILEQVSNKTFVVIVMEVSKINCPNLKVFPVNQCQR